MQKALREFKPPQTATFYFTMFLDAAGGSQKGILVLVVISSLKIPKAFLKRRVAQRNFAHTHAS